MTVSCIDGVADRNCGACAGRDVCKSLFSQLSRSTDRRQDGRNQGQARPIPVFLGRIVRFLREQARPRSSWRRKVEELLEPFVKDEKSSAKSVARALGCSRQTLYRRLKAEGTSFAATFDDLRRRRALAMLRDGATIKNVAYVLDYSDPTAFSRAFKRWTGSSPSDARAGTQIKRTLRG